MGKKFDENGEGELELENISGDSSTKKGGGKAGEDDQSVGSVPFHKLFAFADTLDYVLMAVGTVGAIGNGIAFPIMTVIFGELINSFGFSNIDDVVNTVSKMSLDFLYLAIATGVVAFLQLTCWMITGERQSARIRGLYLRAILRQDVGFFDKETSTGEVIGRMSGDTILIQDAMGEKVGKFIQLVCTFIGGFVVAFVKGWLLALVMIASIPLIVLAGASMAIIVSKLSTRGQAAYAGAGNVAEQTIGSIRTVASFTGENNAIEKYNVSLKSAYNASVGQGFATGLGLASVFVAIFCSYSLCMWFGSRLIAERGYTGGQVINIMIAVMMGGMSLGQASPSVSAFAAGMSAAYKMFETIERKPEIDSSDTSGIVLESLRGEIELKEVNFSYPSRPDVTIFSGFSLHVPSGKVVALVGESGSGKSTVISLIERFYDPLSGEVLIDGINLKNFQIKWIRDQIGLVSQESVLFSTTIKENIGYGKVGATIEEIKQAAELANAMKFIDKMPQGLDTLVGEHGTKLSGGQKQRIAIARAILKNPRILLLDEATSALDAESERVVQDALSNIMTDRTTVVVAHRLSTIKNADLIAVVYRGKIVEMGSHMELVKDAEGAYSQLIRLQEVNKSKHVNIVEYDNDVVVEDSQVPSRLGSWNRSVSRDSSKGSFSKSADPEGVLADNGIAETDKEPQQKVSILRLVALNKPEWPILLLGCVAAIVNGCIFPVLAIIISSIIKTFFEHPFSQMRKDADFWASMYLVLGAAAFLASPTQTYLFGVAGNRLIWRIRRLSFEQVVHQEIGWFDEPANSSGAIGARLSGDAASVRSLVGDALALNVQNIASVTAGMVIAFTACWQLAFVILALVPLIGLQGYIQMKFLKGFSEDAKLMYEEASQVANDAVSSIRTVASFCAEEHIENLYEEKCAVPKKDGVKQGIISGSGFGFSFFSLFAAYALAFYVGAIFVHIRITTFDNVFKVFFALAMAAIGVSQTSGLAPDAAKARASAASIFSVLDRKSKIDPSDNTGLTLESVKADIEILHVSFKYPTRPDVQIFKDLTLTVPSGKTVALVGESGSGKSTVISLLERFYDPDAGSILLNGLEIQKLQLRWLRQQMGLVSQEPILFNDTIRNNIAYGKQGTVTEEEIISVAKAANAHQFISALPQGYDTIAGERGIQMSGGQKQRIAIARAIIKDPMILLLDEATSALDAESERLVQETLDSVMVNRTTIVVAHRLSTIKGADTIAVVKNGVIAEKGRHEALIGIRNGVYASLVQLQMSSSTT